MSFPPPPPPPDSSNPVGQQPGYRVYPGAAGPPVKPKNSGMAVASMVCSLVGLVPCFWVFQIMGVLGVIFGFVGLRQTQNDRMGGRGMAVAGIVIGIILVVACIALWIYFGTHSCVRTGNRLECTTK